MRREAVRRKRPPQKKHPPKRVLQVVYSSVTEARSAWA